MRKWRRNLRNAFLVASGYLLIFLMGKLLSENPGLPLPDWLLDTSPYNHSYLYGWLISHRRYLFVSLISILPTLFGKSRFSATTLAAFAIGLPLGEFLGASPTNSAFGISHYGWAIWGLIFLAGCIMGIVLERFPKYEIHLRSRKFLLWLLIFLMLILGAVFFVRVNM